MNELSLKYSFHWIFISIQKKIAFVVPSPHTSTQVLAEENSPLHLQSKKSLEKHRGRYAEVLYLEIRGTQVSVERLPITEVVGESWHYFSPPQAEQYHLPPSTHEPAEGQHSMAQGTQ